MKKPWTEEDKKLAKKLYLQKKTYTEIANILARSKGSIAKLIYTFRDNDMPKRDGLNQLEADKTEALILYDSGVLIKDIAAKFFKSKYTVQRWISQSRKSVDSVFFEFSTRRNKIEKPTAETVTVQYEYEEYEMPEDALMIPFYLVAVGQCSWVSGSFWDSSDADTLCCGKAVVGLKYKGLRRSYCQFHYEKSLEKEKT